MKLFIYFIAVGVLARIGADQQGVIGGGSNGERIGGDVAEGVYDDQVLDQMFYASQPLVAQALIIESKDNESYVPESVDEGNYQRF